jgi:hypothetical protein
MIKLQAAAVPRHMTRVTAAGRPSDECDDVFLFMDFTCDDHEEAHGSCDRLKGPHPLGMTHLSQEGHPLAFHVSEVADQSHGLLRKSSFVACSLFCTKSRSPIMGLLLTVLGSYLLFAVCHLAFKVRTCLACGLRPSSTRGFPMGELT